MPTSVNGIGTTIAPMPKKDEERLSVIWVIFAYIPLYPRRWVHVRGEGLNRFIQYSSHTRSEANDHYGSETVNRALIESFRWLAGRFALMVGIVVVIFLVAKYH